ncbi:hypothetical protein [Paucisalibacillus globulus]|uniref:hypothetical protein n=1 Tax=Paucisalibacillus globulus TaxID=351095 RepID=UPI00041F344B|nr:hypothetical protein [Paucisalibacillus globulus]
MEKYNLVNESNRTIPNYDISEKEISIDVYVSHDKELCIIGRIDINYICWAVKFCSTARS